MSDAYDALEAHGIEPHPDGDKFDPGAWDVPARCICGLALPPQREWCGAGLQWQHIACPTCQRSYVDEDDFFAIYDEPIDCEDCEGDNGHAETPGSSALNGSTPTGGPS